MKAFSRVLTGTSKILKSYLDDLFFMLGCLCILKGLSMWSVIVTWIAAGIMLIFFGFLAAKEMTDVSTETNQEQ
jgi:hypothetical protein